VYGLFSIKTNEQRVRQQYMFAARGDIAQFRHREVRWEGLIMFSRKIITVFWQQKRDTIVPPLLCMNRGVHLRFEIWTPTSFWYTLIIFTVYIWKDKHKFCVRIEIDLKFVHTVLYQNALWHGNNCLIVCYFSFAKKTDPWYIWTINPREYILEPHYLFPYFSIF
jgi:hypothetical protein